MPWVKLDDNFPRHPKVLGLSDAGFRLYVTGLCYSAQYLTDGWVPQTAVMAGRRTVTELVTRGLWHEDPDGTGYTIHDYLTYQPSRDYVETLRQRRSDAGRKGARSRWNGTGTSDSNSHS